MAINWGLLDTDAPAKIASAFTEAREKRDQRSALSQYADDPDAAFRSALATGDPELAGTVRDWRSSDAEAKRKAAVENLTAYKGVMETLAKVPMAQREQFRQQMLADPSVKWLPPDAMQAARQAPLDDANMARYLAQVEEKILEVEHGKAVVGVKDGKAREIYVRPEKPEYQVVPEGAAAYPVGGNVVRGLIPDAPPATAPDKPAAARDVPDTLAEAVTSLFPGARVTSTLRSRAEQDRLIAEWEAGGRRGVRPATNSRHLQRGAAVDFVPPAGVSMAEAQAEIERRYGGKALNEGDHVHWQPAEALMGGDIDDTLTSGGGVDALPGGGQDMMSADGRPVLRGPPKAPKPDPDRVTPALAETMRHNRVLEEQAAAKLPKPGGKLDKQDLIYINKMRADARQARHVAVQTKRFVELNKKVSTGPNMAQRFMDRTFDPRFREMEAIRDELTPQMRQGLPGAASDRDVQMFQSATVGTDKLGPTNQSIATAAEAFARRQTDYVAFLEWYAKQNGTTVGADEEWSTYSEGNPLFGAKKDGGLRVLPQEPWRRWFNAGQPPGRRGPAPKAPAAKMTDAQIKAALGLK